MRPLLKDESVDDGVFVNIAALEIEGDEVRFPTAPLTSPCHSRRWYSGFTWGNESRKFMA